MHAQAVLANALVVAQAGGAGVPGAGSDLSQAIAHGDILKGWVYR
jgi:hypothetical protein